MIFRNTCRKLSIVMNRHLCSQIQRFSFELYNAEPLYPYHHPFYVDCNRGAIYHVENKKIEYLTPFGYSRIKHKLINDGRSLLKSELIYNHSLNQIALDKHLRIIHVDGDYTNHQLSNLTE
eukprot:265179_1